jgi:phage gp36-like protein
MSYTTQARIESAIPRPLLIEALDDDGDGQLDEAVLAEVLASADQAVDATLAGLFVVPFVSVPAAVAEAAFAFACERIYDRRLQGSGDKNPWRDQADKWRERLEKIGRGELPLDASLEKTFAPGSALTSNVSVDGSMT